MRAKIILYKHKVYNDGTFPVVLQVVIKGKPVKKTLFSIHEKHWNAKTLRVKPSHELFNQYNELIIKSLHGAELKLINAKINGVDVNKKYLFGANVVLITLEDVFKKYMDRLVSEKKFTALEKAQSVLSKLNKFSPGILVPDVTGAFMDRFYNYLLGFNNPNTAAKNISVIITALKGAEVKSIDPSALKSRKKQVPTTKDKLSKDEVIKMINLPLGNALIGVVRDSFLLAFYFRGMRISDVLTLQWSEIRGERLIRQARKTDKIIDLFIVPQAKSIIDKYVGVNAVYVLPVLKLLPPKDINDNKYRKHIEAKTSVCNKYLKIIAGMAEIDKNLTNHVARHTFAYLADQSGMTAKRIQDLLDHYDLKTTQNYIEDLNKNDVLDKVMSEFVKGF